MADQPNNQGTTQTPPNPGGPDPLNVFRQPTAKEATVQLEVYGNPVEVAMPEAIKYAQKGLAADQRFQEAAKMVKEAERGKQFEVLLTKMQQGDENAFRELGKLTNLPSGDVENAIQTYFRSIGETDTEEEEWDDEEPVATPAAAPTEIGFQHFSQEVKDNLLASELDRQDRLIEKALDKDEVIGYYMKDRAWTDEQRNAIRNAVRIQVQGRLKAGERFGLNGDILNDILPPIRNMLKAVGATKRNVPQVGLGPALGLPSDDVYPTKMPERVSSSDQTEFEDFITRRLAFELAQGTSN